MKKIASALAERGANYAKGAASRAPYNVRQAIAVADSIKISAVSGEVINELMITINAVYYYLFLDEGTSRGIPPYSITDSWLKRSDTQAIIGEIVGEYVAWQFETYPLLDLAPILNNPKVEIQFNWIDSPYPDLPTAPQTAFF